MSHQELSSVLLLAANGSSALITFLVYTLAVFGIAALSNRLLQERNFLKEYFLGSRSLGVWALALTFAATSASGGSFTGFPSFIYTHGWVLALWIGSYMIFPICTMGLLGKRINQVARKTGAITVPDILRDRYQSPTFSLIATSLIVFFTCVNLVAQFKSGSKILQSLLGENSVYVSARNWLANVTADIPAFAGLDPGYLLCLVTFGVAVIIYTTWGGFHAVVWTDVMQGCVMVLGVIIMLPLAIHQVGGLQHATEELARMIPPHDATIRIAVNEALPNADATDAANDGVTVPKAAWLKTDAVPPQIFRTKEISVCPAKGDAVEVSAIEIVDPGDRQRIQSGDVDVQFVDGIAIREIVKSTPPKFPKQERAGAYVTAPGPSMDKEAGWLPMSLAFSMFFYWAISGAGQPSSMVRLMAFRQTRTLRISIITVAIYFSCIYFPLVVIFCCSRLLLPGLEVDSDAVMPQMAVTLTRNLGADWMAGLLVAAPFAAVMSTVDSFLLMISSAIVRDVYQRNINPQASQKTLQKLSYMVTFLVGAGIVVAAANPPKFLQYIIVYVGSGLAACFLAPVSLTLYWKRTTKAGAIGSMLAGFCSHFSLYAEGALRGAGFNDPWRPFSLDPVVIGIAASFLTGFAISLLTPPPSEEDVRRYFYRRRFQTAAK
ncbi:MAG: hypothetical protein KDA89_02490 [Planctomycetaceae bacterium]|nr:hypothetical protein [Planctomycetaceae bacterium]